MDKLDFFNLRFETLFVNLFMKRYKYSHKIYLFLQKAGRILISIVFGLRNKGGNQTENVIMKDIVSLSVVLVKKSYICETSNKYQYMTVKIDNIPEIGTWF